VRVPHGRRHAREKLPGAIPIRRAAGVDGVMAMGGIDCRRYLFLTPRASFSFPSRHNETRLLSTRSTLTRYASALGEEIALTLRDVQGARRGRDCPGAGARPT
jgi:hypothetical protein